MAEYIEREAALSRIRTLQETESATVGKKQFADGYFLGLDEAEIITMQAPAADVAEVVHGHNKTSMHPVDEFLCSVCGFCCADYTETKYDEDGDYTYSCECEFDYCPKCGAKMDGDENG